MASLINSISNEQFCDIVKNSTSYAECLQKLGYLAKSGTIYKIIQQKVKMLQIDTSHFQQSPKTERTRENIFVQNSTCDQKVLRRWFKREPIPYECAICGQQPFWNGKEMIMILDHINGVNNDDRLTNLRWVCPNCNSQLPTSNGKNIKHKHKKQSKSEFHIFKCPYCENLVEKENQVCRQCKIKINKEKCPDNLTLARLIIEKGFTETSILYDVSRGTVQHWCKTLNIPVTKKELIVWYANHDTT